MLACSFCGGVEAPAWFTSTGFWAVIGALVALGVGVGAAGLLRADWHPRSGALRVGFGLAVLLPAAVLVAWAGGTRIDVEVAESPADSDSGAWSVSCETFHESAAAGNELQEAFVGACASTTRPARWTSGVLTVAAGMLAIDGARRSLAARSASLRHASGAIVGGGRSAVEESS